MVAALETVRAEIAAIVGEDAATTSEQMRAAAGIDEQMPQIVAYPSSAEQVAATLRYASERSLAVVPWRNGTKLAMGNRPRQYDIALSLKNMNRVWHYEPADLTVSAEPGMKFGDFQHFVARDKLWLPLDPPGGMKATLGGILATNSAGPMRFRYGAPRDMVLGMKIATTEGKLVKTGGRVVKNVAGYDLGKLLMGSFGTLGVIVEASFKLFPLPVERATFVLSVESLDSAGEFRRRILRSPFDPMRMVLLDSGARKLVTDGALSQGSQNGYEIWIEAGGSKRVVERYTHGLQDLCAQIDARMRPLEAEAADHGWPRIADFGATVTEQFPHAIVLKAALPISAAEEFLARANEIAGSARPASLIQIGVGIVRVALLDEPEAPVAAALITKLRQVAENLLGTLLVECCPAELKERVDVWGTVGDDFEVMRKLKEAWDPKGILSPGRFVGGL